MARAAALTALALLLALAGLACGGAEREDPPAPTSSPAAATPSPTPTPDPTAPPDPTPTAPADEPLAHGYEIVTLLRPDAIPAINDPLPITREQADEQLRPDDLVIGVSLNGEHRAYGTAFLSGHEIVNDTLGGRAIAVTW